MSAKPMYSEVFRAVITLNANSVSCFLSVVELVARQHVTSESTTQNFLAMSSTCCDDENS